MAPSFDPGDPAFQADPYPAYRRLLREGPVHAMRVGAGERVWHLPRHADVHGVLRDPRFRVSEETPGGGLPPDVPERIAETFELVRAMMLRRDPPDHTRLRRLVALAFTPRRVEKLRPAIEELAHELLWENAGVSRLDAIADLAAPLPVRVIGELLGLPRDDLPRLEGWSHDLAPMLDGHIRHLHLERILSATRALAGYFEEAVSRRRADPGDDLLSALVAARDEGDALDDHEVVATAVLLLAAGHETTTGLIGNGVLALLRHPEQQEILRAEPERMPLAVEEMLRFDPPVQMTSRRPGGPVTLHGVEIPAGEEVDLLIGAANRDPEVFPAPDRFDVTRGNAGQHLAFGQGVHFCLGAALARSEAELALRALLATRPTLCLAGEPERRPGVVLRRLRALPVRF